MKIKNIVELLAGEVHLGSPGNKYAVVLNNKFMKESVQKAFRGYLLNDLGAGWRSYSSHDNKISVSVLKNTNPGEELVFTFHSANDLNGEDVTCDRVFMDVLTSREVLPWKLETDDMILLR